jgi:hypothetical protein
MGDSRRKSPRLFCQRQHKAGKLEQGTITPAHPGRCYFPRTASAALAESAMVTSAAPSMMASFTTKRPRPLR